MPEKTLFFNWSQHHVHGAAFRPWRLFHLSDIHSILFDPFQNSQTSVLMDDFTAPEKYRDFAPVAAFKKTTDVLELCLVIVLVGFGAKLDFLNLDHSLFLFGFLLAFLLLILELTIVHDLTYRRVCLLCYFNQIKTPFLGYLEGFMCGKNSQLFTFIIDNSDLGYSNALVSAGTVIPAIGSPTVSMKSYSSCLRV